MCLCVGNRLQEGSHLPINELNSLKNKLHDNVEKVYKCNLRQRYFKLDLPMLTTVTVSLIKTSCVLQSCRYIWKKHTFVMIWLFSITELSLWAVKVRNLSVCEADVSVWTNSKPFILKFIQGFWQHHYPLSLLASDILIGKKRPLTVSTVCIYTAVPFWKLNAGLKVLLAATQ